MKRILILAAHPQLDGPPEGVTFFKPPGWKKLSSSESLLPPISSICEFLDSNENSMSSSID